MAKVNEGRDQPHPAVAALADLSREAVAPPTPAELSEGLAAVRSHLRAERTARPRRVRWTVAAAMTGLLLAIGAWRLSPALRNRAPVDPAPVAVARVEGGALLEGGYLSASQHETIRVLFNEGTEFLLQPGTRGRMREAGGNGAHLDIESGAASFRVTQNPARRWTIEAGPFLVTVKGTVFDVSWDPREEQFDLVLRRGHVAVSGPIVGSELPLHAGQHLVVRLPRAQSVITEDVPPEGTGAATAAPPVQAPPPARRVPHKAAAVAMAPAPGGRRWPALLARGQWDRILTEAGRDGVEATVETASSEDLFALADAARYRRRVDVARMALLAQRRRFPESSRSQDALFLLGRVEELRAGGAARAVALYDDYLAGAPRGGYAAEALGRKMVLTRETAGAAAARPIAEEYLRRFPSGSYAGTARALTHLP